MRRTQRLAATLLCGLLALAACGRGADAEGDDPMAALASDSPSSRYQTDFWSAERRRGSALWRQATKYCTPERAATKPNCRAVLSNVAAERGNARADSALRAAGSAAADAKKPSDLEFRP